MSPYNARPQQPVGLTIQTPPPQPSSPFQAAQTHSPGLIQGPVTHLTRKEYGIAQIHAHAFYSPLASDDLFSFVVVAVVLFVCLFLCYSRIPLFSTSSNVPKLGKERPPPLCPDCHFGGPATQDREEILLF